MEIFGSMCGTWQTSLHFEGKTLRRRDHLKPKARNKRPEAGNPKPKTQNRKRPN